MATGSANLERPARMQQVSISTDLQATQQKRTENKQLLDDIGRKVSCVVVDVWRRHGGEVIGGGRAAAQAG